MITITPDINGTVSAIDACHHVWQSTQCPQTIVKFAIGEWAPLLAADERIDLGELDAWIRDRQIEAIADLIFD